MANYYEHVSFTFAGPASLLDDPQLQGMLAACGARYAYDELRHEYWIVDDGDGLGTGSAEFMPDGVRPLDGYEEWELHDVIFEIITRSNGAIAYVAYQTSLDCSSPRTDAYGGLAFFITAQDVKSISTQQWIWERIDEFNRRPNQKEIPDA